MARNHAFQEKLHEYFLQRAVQILHQALAQAQVRLRAGEQILHQIAEARAALHELHHPMRDAAKQESAEEYAPGERRGIFQIVREFACDRVAISRAP